MRHHHHHHHRSHLRQQLPEQSSFKKTSTDKTNELPTLSGVDTLSRHLQQSRDDQDNNDHDFRRSRHSGRKSSKNSSDDSSRSFLDDDDDDDEWPANNSSSSPSWQSFVHHTRLQGQTTDPEALRWDKAVDAFRYGVQQVRKGHRLHGAVAIGTSLLLDTRAYKACRRLPTPSSLQNDDDDDDGKHGKAAAADCLLDESVALTLLQHQKDHVIIQLCASMVVAMRTEHWKGHTRHKHTTTPFSQQQQILRMIDTTKNILAQRPTILEIADKPGDEACWSMEHWHYWWAMRYLAVDGDVYWENALVELNQAIELNPNHVRARYHVALLYSQYNETDIAATSLYEKWKNYVDVAHVDDFYLHDAYTWMAYLVLETSRNDIDIDCDDNSIVISDSNSSNSIISDLDDSRDQDNDDDGTNTSTADDPSLFSKASDHLQASDEALRRHVNLYAFVTTTTTSCLEQNNNYMLWYSSNHYDHDNDTTAANIMKNKAQAVARLRSHPDQRPWIKYWTDDAPSLQLPL
jgi:tetratricopeptide (TPR) repeat protein